MGSDSERRRAVEHRKRRHTEEEGKLLWDALELLEKTDADSKRVQQHNAHILRKKRVDSERRYRQRRREEEGKG
jgi:hypothetical protein